MKQIKTNRPTAIRSLTVAAVACLIGLALTSNGLAQSNSQQSEDPEVSESASTSPDASNVENDNSSGTRGAGELDAAGGGTVKQELQKGVGKLLGSLFDRLDTQISHQSEARSANVGTQPEGGIGGDEGAPSDGNSTTAETASPPEDSESAVAGSDDSETATVAESKANSVTKNPEGSASADKLKHPRAGKSTTGASLRRRPGRVAGKLSGPDGRTRRTTSATTRVRHKPSAKSNRRAATKSRRNVKSKRRDPRRASPAGKSTAPRRKGHRHRGSRHHQSSADRSNSPNSQ